MYIYYNDCFKTKIKRNGYGSLFNSLYINDNKTLIKKETFHLTGIKKLKNEMDFYKFIIMNDISINIPTIYYYSDNYYIMNYIDDNNYKLADINNRNDIIAELKKLHLYKSIEIDKNYYKKLLFEETIIKTNDRFIEFAEFINNFESKNKIIKVNNLPILNYSKIMELLTSLLDSHMEKINKYHLNVIHGDPHFNNIFTNEKNELIFIDPKGTFGSSKIYGIKEYDIAKVFFAMSGYSYFDNLDICEINISNNDNLIIDFIKIPDFSISDDYNKSLIIYLFISIWLSNPHAFINEPNKLIYSYYIGLYFSSYLLSDYNH